MQIINYDVLVGTGLLLVYAAAWVNFLESVHFGSDYYFLSFFFQAAYQVWFLTSYYG